MQGDLDTSVLVGGADGNANFDRVSVRATVETDATDEQFATLVAETERRCPVTQLFKRSGVEWDNQLGEGPPAREQADAPRHVGRTRRCPIWWGPACTPYSPGSAGWEGLTDGQGSGSVIRPPEAGVWHGEDFSI